MVGSRQSSGITESDNAVQHSRAPRPLPLFLELLRAASERDPKLATKALQGLRKYEQAERRKLRRERPIAAQHDSASLRDCGGVGPAVILVPSLINPPEILDLDEEVSLANAIAAMGRRTLLLDWGQAQDRAALDVGGHVSKLLVPLIRDLTEPPALIGYCLGGTMAIAAANMVETARVATIATPWRFSGYAENSRQSLLRLWNGAQETAAKLGALPMEVLQGAFWSLDPERTVSKFAAFAYADPESAKARRFVTLEDWANEGEPLPCPAARELIEDLFGSELPERGEWRIDDRPIGAQLKCPLLNIAAVQDRITPADAAPAHGQSVAISAGHVGMVVGSKRAQLHGILNDFLAADRRRR